MVCNENASLLVQTFFINLQHVSVFWYTGKTEFF